LYCYHVLYLSIDRDNENKNESFDYVDFYRHNREIFNKLVESASKMFYDGIIYLYNSNIANEMRKTYEKNYKQYLLCCMIRKTVKTASFS